MLTADLFQSRPITLGAHQYAVWVAPFAADTSWEEWEVLLLGLLKQGKNLILLNLSGLNTIHLNQMNLLLHILRLIHHHGGYLALIQLSSDAFSEIKTHKLEAVFDIFSTEAKALAELRHVIPWYQPR